MTKLTLVVNEIRSPKDAIGHKNPIAAAIAAKRDRCADDSPRIRGHDQVVAWRGFLSGALV